MAHDGVPDGPSERVARTSDGPSAPERAARTGDGPRERAARAGIEALADHELVALVLGTGRPGEPAIALAASLLDQVGGLHALSHAGPGELAARAGIGAAKGARLAGALELGARAFRAGFVAMSPFLDSRATAAWAAGRLAWLDHEELWGLALDGRRRLRAARRLASGGLHGVHLGVRDALRAMIREAASSFVLVHNHPSGDATPSEEDVVFTLRIAEAADIVGTPLVDHVVVSRHGHTSLLAAGLLVRQGPMLPLPLSP